MKKKLLALLLGLTLCLSLAACGGSTDDTAADDTADTLRRRCRGDRHPDRGRLSHSPRRDPGAVRAHPGGAGHRPGHQ